LFGFMVLLLIWAITNIGLWFYNKDRSKEYMKYYWQMGALWGVINLSVAIFSIILALTRLNSYKNDTGLQELQIWIVAANILFDLMYVGIGAVLESKGKKQSSDRLKGYGLSVQLQGAFLFLFDTLLTIGLLIAVI